jgi:hypothetical protein
MQCRGGIDAGPTIEEKWAATKGRGVIRLLVTEVDL